jgi:hypothetical protein
LCSFNADGSPRNAGGCNCKEEDRTGSVVAFISARGSTTDSRFS